MEKKKMKTGGKVAIGILLLVLIVPFTVFLFWVGCNSYTDKAVGDFNVRLYWNYCSIIGTTEQGNNQRFLVIPKEIEGKQVRHLGVENNNFIYGSLKITRPEIESNTIERVYFEGELSAYPASFHYTRTPNVSKVMFVGGEAHFLNRSSGRRIHLPREVFANDGGNQDLQTWFHTVPANVSYYYNYDKAENDGYYWIDDYDYGSKIEYTPKEPIRKGYTFGGWYKETDCINEWDFANDTLPEKEIDENEDENVYYYQETILYAKWTR